jgi:hypothetical protein
VSDKSARWALHGESVVALLGVRPAFLTLPRPLHRLPGPTLVVAERFTESPVGAFTVLSVGVPVRLGVRPAWHYFISVISSTNARRAGRSFWGFPHQTGTVSWMHEGRTTRVRWEEQELSIDALAGRKPFPFLLPVRSAQVRGDGPVVVPEWTRGIAHRSQISISTAEQGPGAFLHGEHKGFCISGLHVRRSPARVPAGLFSSLRAPSRAPEPGVAGISRSQRSSERPLPSH